MKLIERIEGILGDRDIIAGQLRVTVNDATNVIHITVNPNNDKPDQYTIVNVEKKYE